MRAVTVTLWLATRAADWLRWMLGYLWKLRMRTSDRILSSSPMETPNVSTWTLLNAVHILSNEREKSLSQLHHLKQALQGQPPSPRLKKNPFRPHSSLKSPRPSPRGPRCPSRIEVQDNSLQRPSTSPSVSTIARSLRSKRTRRYV